MRPREEVVLLMSSIVPTGSTRWTPRLRVDAWGYYVEPMSSIPSDEDRLDTRLLWMIVVVLLGGLLGILNSTMAAVATDTLATTFGTSLSTIGWTSTGFLLAVTATIPFTTWAVDRFGGKRLWLAGLL